MHDIAKLKPKDAPDLGRFDWEDALRLESQLTEEERMMRDAARAMRRTSCSPASSPPIVTRSPTPRFSARWAKWGFWA